MGLETGVDYLDDLNKLWPLGSDLGSTADDHLRLIKKALVQSFPNITGAMNATQAELNYMVGVTSAVQTQLDAISGGGTPIGGIIMFSGTIANLGAHWKVCDGNNGTPNLTDKFILGTVTQGEIGDTGGSADAIAVSHTHTFTSDTDGGHGHNLEMFDGTANQQGTTGYFTDVDADGDAQMGSTGGSNNTAMINSGTDSNHAHSGTTASAGSSGTNANLPPYYKLAYIMRIS